MNIQQFCEQIKKKIQIEFDPAEGKWRTSIDGIFIPVFYPNNPTIYFTHPTPQASMEYYVRAIRGQTIAIEKDQHPFRRDFSKDIKVPDDLEGISFS